ncbi:MAG: class I SAM-dependent methyltransferase [Candidatus Sumerlaeota bacterium]
MDPAEYEKMYDLEDYYWWFQGRKRVVTRLLDALPKASERPKVLDLGCGTGLMLKHLDEAYDPVGLDFSELALHFSRRRGAGKLVRGDAQVLPFADNSFDLVTSLDLAEHVEADTLMLREVERVLKPGGHLILTVPAHPFLWSEHDDVLYHFRRYRRPQLQERVEYAGLGIERLTYCITFTFPVIAGYRLVQKFFRKQAKPKTHLIVLPNWANRILLGLVRFEAYIIRWIDLPFGVTLIAQACKKGKGGKK